VPAAGVQPVHPPWGITDLWSLRTRGLCWSVLPCYATHGEQARSSIVPMAVAAASGLHSSGFGTGLRESRQTSGAARRPRVRDTWLDGPEDGCP